MADASTAGVVTGTTGATGCVTKTSAVDGMAAMAQAKAASHAEAGCSSQSSPLCCEPPSLGIGIPGIAAGGLPALAVE